MKPKTSVNAAEMADLNYEKYGSKVNLGYLKRGLVKAYVLVVSRKDINEIKKQEKSFKLFQKAM